MQEINDELFLKAYFLSYTTLFKPSAVIVLFTTIYTSL